MRDIAILLFVVACIVAAFRKPWLGVLALAVFSYLNPHRYAWGFALTLPVYQILFFAVLVSFLINHDDRQTLPRDWRIPAFFSLWAYFLLTTTVALAPYAAWPKLIEVSKIYLPFVLTLWLINTRKKLFYLVITIAGSIGLVAVKGGIFSIATGFSYRVWGPNGTQFYGNNEFAIATLMAIPLLILWLREVNDFRQKYALMASIPLCFASAIASYSRGAFLTIGALAIVLLWNTKRKWLVLPIMLVGAYVAIQSLPDKWFGRMATIETYQEDKSAQGRLEVWRDGIEYALSHPLTGSGFDGWRRVSYRDWHSAYVEMVAEHGFIALLLWLSMLFGTMLSLTRLPKKTKHVPELAWVTNYSHMLRASLVAYAVGSIFLGITYWDLLYHIIFIAVLVRKFALVELADYNARQSLTSPGPAKSIATMSPVGNPRY